MRILLTGATGLIGRAVLAGLQGAGHSVRAVSRGADARWRLPPGVDLVSLDIAKAVLPADWLPHLAGVDAVVNCAGVLQDSARDSTQGVHVAGASALFAACEQGGVRRVVQVSALGVDRDAATAFARTKRAGDERLMASGLDWVILRPSVVVGRAAYGGSALFRGLAALPVTPMLADSGPLQVVQLDDLVRTVLALLAPGAPARITLDIVGPEKLPLSEVLAAYRRWLGWETAQTVRLPGWLAGMVFRLGDCAGWLGWRPPLRTTLGLELARSATGDAAEWTRLTGIVPRSLGTALAAEPASVQERWFAQLYFVKPLLLVVLSLFWIATGLLSLSPAWREGVELLIEAGLSPSSAAMAAMAGAITDIAIGAAIMARRGARLGLWAGLALCVAYALLGTLLLPRLWLDPLGALVKIAPIAVLHLAALAMLDER